MKMIYFITAYATFASITMAQAASFIGNQRLVEKVSFYKSSLSDAQMGNSLGEALRTKFSSIGNNQQERATQLVPVASSTKKKRGPRKDKKQAPRKDKKRVPHEAKKRPDPFTKGPMSY